MVRPRCGRITCALHCGPAAFAAPPPPARARLGAAPSRRRTARGVAHRWRPGPASRVLFPARPLRGRPGGRLAVAHSPGPVKGLRPLRGGLWPPLTAPRLCAGRVVGARGRPGPVTGLGRSGPSASGGAHRHTCRGVCAVPVLATLRLRAVPSPTPRPGAAALPPSRSSPPALALSRRAGPGASAGPGGVNTAPRLFRPRAAALASANAARSRRLRAGYLRIARRKKGLRPFTPFGNLGATGPQPPTPGLATKCCQAWLPCLDTIVTTGGGKFAHTMAANRHNKAPGRLCPGVFVCIVDGIPPT